MLGMFIFSLTGGVWTLLAGVLGLPLLLLCPRLPLWFPIMWARGILCCWRLSGRRLAYRGLDNIPAGGAVIASQHQSALETIVFTHLLSCPAYVLKRELHYLPIFGWYLAKAGMVAIDRIARVQALNSVISQAEGILSSGRRMVIFPEGTRVPIGESRPYNKSIYRLYSLGYPVVPVALNTGLLWRKGAKSLGRGEAVFSFLEPMPAGLSQSEFMERLRLVIESEASRL